MMNHMVSMVGPMAGMNGGAMPEMQGKELASGSLGAGLEPSLGPTLDRDRAVMTGMRPSDMKSEFKVPGYPQDMMDMPSAEEMRKLQVPLTRGVRRNWPIGTMAMMTVLRVLPDELYDKVVSGKGDVDPGESVPGGGPGEEKGQGMEGMNMQGMQGMENTKDMGGDQEMQGMKDMKQDEQQERSNSGSRHH
jgi:manganese oxidase